MNFKYKIKEFPLFNVFTKDNTKLGTLSVLHNAFEYYHDTEISDEEYKEITNKIIEDICVSFGIIQHSKNE